MRVGSNPEYRVRLRLSGDRAPRPGGELRRMPAHARVRMLESTLQCIEYGVVVVDAAGRFQFFNEAAERILGVGSVDVEPQSWSQTYGCFQPDRVTPFPSQELPLARALRGERVRDVEIFVRNPRVPEGVWISVTGSPLTGAGGTNNGATMVFHDVTDRRHASETVRRLSEAVEHTTDSVVILDAKAKIEYVNPAFETITGYARSEVVGRPASILETEEDAGADEDGFWVRPPCDDDGSHTLLHRRSTGEVFQAELTVTPVRDESGYLTHFVSVMRDVTDQRKAQAREVEMRLARLIQQKLYPAEAPELPGFDLAGATFPADATCGDYYDFIPMTGGRLCIAVGDVSGHGFGPALLMAETRAYLRSLSKATSDLEWILRRLNLFLSHDTEDERFVTLMLVILDPERRSLVYASAGHVPGMLLDRSGETRRILESTGVPLGIFPEASFASSPEVLLDEGDLFVLLTDGAAEAQDANGRFFEAKRVEEVVSGLRQAPAHEIIGGLHDAVDVFAAPGPAADDITAVVCKALPPATGGTP
jgi:PAS domain S-box-containing protein